MQHLPKPSFSEECHGCMQKQRKNKQKSIAANPTFDRGGSQLKFRGSWGFDPS
jgi:hypothetical protein